MNELDYIAQCSQYFAILLRNDPACTDWLLGQGNLRRKYPLTALYSALRDIAWKADCFNDLVGLFRRFKQLHFLRIGARDFCGYAELAETTGQLSDLASVSLQVGLETLSAHPDWWAPYEDPELLRRLECPVPLVILGMGKLGGHELNYVSDVDLVFLYPDREDAAPARLLSLLIHRLSRLLSDQFEGDRVFQVDFRLRPGGKEGVLAHSVSAALDYYLIHGKSWERQMLLKCRPVAGDRSEGNNFIREVRPFVFRRFLDFQALAEIKEMRNRVLEEAGRYHPSARGYDVKLGIGGIREIEFLVQSLQLIYGGRKVELDEPNTLCCLDKLSNLGLLPAQTACDLKASYIFLRNLEHRVQLDQNRHTQQMPLGEKARLRLTLAMGFEDDEKAFLEALQAHSQFVNAAFLDLFGEKPAASTFSARDDFQKAKPGSSPAVDSYFEKVARRSGLMKLFSTGAPWVRPFCRLLASSDFASSLLSVNPALVEGCTAQLESAAQWEKSASELVDRAGDYPEKLEWIRKLKNERTLRLALADLEGEVDFAALEAELSALAEFVVRKTLSTVIENLGLAQDLPLSILAMGKLGSAEMSYLSDLDLVFVYSPPSRDAMIPSDVVRLIQRFMNMLQVPLAEGPGYPMDVRLRPTGTHGPLAVTEKSWLQYYKKADIWEIQALLRVRHIAGNDSLGRRLEEKSVQICSAPRSSEAVWPRICHLRGRMERERAVESGGEIDLKLGSGGLTDVEFIVQGQLLTGALPVASLAGRPVRQIVEQFSRSDPRPGAQKLAALFGALRALDHRVRLHKNSSSAKLDESSFKAMVSLGLWPPRGAGSRIESWEDVLRLRRQIRSVFSLFCP
jgi:glutamate-ammonia-ligase adenylyltransferase